MTIIKIISWTFFLMCVHCCFFLSIWVSWKKKTHHLSFWLLTLSWYLWILEIDLICFFSTSIKKIFDFSVFDTLQLSPIVPVHHLQLWVMVVGGGWQDMVEAFIRYGRLSPKNSLGTEEVGPSWYHCKPGV